MKRRESQKQFEEWVQPVFSALRQQRQKEAVKTPPEVWVKFRARLEEEKEETGWWREENRSLGFLGASAVGVAALLLVLNWATIHQEEENLALNNFLTKSQYGKVLVVF